MTFTWTWPVALTVGAVTVTRPLDPDVALICKTALPVPEAGETAIFG
jgi:hypothetical protein